MASMYCSIASCSVVVCVTENKSISVSDVMLITLYDMAGKMATRPQNDLAELLAVAQDQMSQQAAHGRCG